MYTQCIRHSAFASVLAAYLIPFPATAETKLTDLSGNWRGTGSDRDSPFESSQKTNCHTQIEADESHLSTLTVCKGERDLHKEIRLRLKLDGDKFTGSVNQTSLARGDTSPDEIKGSVLGHRTKGTANLRVHLPGLLPDATVVLVLRSTSSYTMRVTSLGVTMMDVTFSKIVKP